MKGVGASKTLVTIYYTTWHYISDHALNIHCG